MHTERTEGPKHRRKRARGEASGAGAPWGAERGRRWLGGAGPSSASEAKVTGSTLSGMGICSRTFRQKDMP